MTDAQPVIDTAFLAAAAAADLDDWGPLEEAASEIGRASCRERVLMPV